jgi:formate dehydrogenase major subunit
MKVAHADDRSSQKTSASGVMELYISDHPLDCLTCSANGNCELQDMAGVTVGLREVRYGLRRRANHAATTGPRIDNSNPYFTLRPREVHRLFSRCVRACEETQGTFALTIERARLRVDGVARARTSPSWSPSA